MGNFFKRIKLNARVIGPVIAILFILIIVGFAVIPEVTRTILLILILLVLAAVPVLAACRIRKEHVTTTFSGAGFKRLGLMLAGVLFCALVSSVIVSGFLHEAVPVLQGAICPVGFTRSSPEVVEWEYEEEDSKTHVVETRVHKETCLVCETDRYDFTIGSFQVFVEMVFIHMTLSLLTVIAGILAALLFGDRRPRLKTAVPAVFFIVLAGLFYVPSPVSAALQGVYRFVFYGGNTPLLYNAVEENDLEMLDGLLAEGAAINSRSSSGNTALMYAVKEEEPEIIPSLVERGADPNIPDAEGLTPLMRAVEAGDTEMVELLLKGKADVNAKNPSGETALVLARKSGKQVIIDMILRREPKER